MFSVTVLHDDRIVLVAEQRPDASEEDSFQWMSRVLQVGAARAFSRLSVGVWFRRVHVSWHSPFHSFTAGGGACSCSMLGMPSPFCNHAGKAGCPGAPRLLVGTIC